MDENIKSCYGTIKTVDEAAKTWNPKTIEKSKDRSTLQVIRNCVSVIVTDNPNEAKLIAKAEETLAYFDMKTRYTDLERCSPFIDENYTSNENYNFVE